MEVPAPAPVQPITMTLQLSGPQVAYFPDRVNALTQQIPAAVAALVPPLSERLSRLCKPMHAVLRSSIKLR